MSIEEIRQRADLYRDKPKCGVKTERYVADIDYLMGEIDRLTTETNIIHCHDCTHYRAQRIINSEPMCYVCCRTNGYSPGENHYCAWGEQSPIPMRYRYTAGCTCLCDEEE